jgi:quercetin dioxygenase-like cupin family protein
MMNRRFLLGAWGAIAAGSAQPAENRAETVRRQPLREPFAGWEAEFVSVTMNPGPRYAPHRHDGFVPGYVIEGSFRFALDGQPELVLHAGEAFYEPPSAYRTVSANADPGRSARVLAIVIAEKKK